MNALTSAELRSAAKAIRNRAQFVSGPAYYAEMEEARALDRQADELDEETEARRSADYEKTRKRLVAKVKIAQKELVMDDDTYRELLFSMTQKRSASELGVVQLHRVIARLEALGFKGKPAVKAKARTLADDPQDRLIRKLWLKLHEDGKIDDSSERALIHWIRGQFRSSHGIEALQWLSIRQKARVIEQLKQWLNRK